MRMNYDQVAGYAEDGRDDQEPRYAGCPKTLRFYVSLLRADSSRLCSMMAWIA